MNNRPPIPILKIITTSAPWLVFCIIVIILLGTDLVLPAKIQHGFSFLLPSLIVFSILQLVGRLLTLLMKHWSCNIIAKLIGALSWVLLVTLALLNSRISGLVELGLMTEDVKQTIVSIAWYIALGVLGISSLGIRNIPTPEMPVYKYRSLFTVFCLACLCVFFWKATGFFGTSALAEFFRLILVYGTAFIALAQFAGYARKTRSEFLGILGEKLEYHTFIGPLILSLIIAYLIALRPSLYDQPSLYPIMEWFVATLTLGGLYFLSWKKAKEDSEELAFIGWSMHQQVISPKKDNWYRYLTNIQDSFINTGQKFDIIAQIVLTEYQLGCSIKEIIDCTRSLIEFNDTFPLPALREHTYYVWDRSQKRIHQNWYQIKPLFPWQRKRMLKQGTIQRRRLLDETITAAQNISSRPKWAFENNSDQATEVVKTAFESFVSEGNRIDLIIQLIIALQVGGSINAERSEIINPLLYYRETKPPFFTFMWSKQHLHRWKVETRASFANTLQSIVKH